MSLFRCSDDGFEFRFTAQNGRCFRSVAIVNGAPEFRFDPSPNVPALTEADLADAFRLALEGRRPEFYYVPIPPTHPFFGRQYKQYIPEWLEGTSIGETLSQTDWAMKGLTHGLRSDDSKTEFWAWERTSQLKGLATASEFPKDKSGGSVIMSCESVRVRKSDSEMEFVGEPRLHINDECSSAYTRYINRVLPSVAYHDEPLFLKIGEILKLILAAEWLVAEKGVKISQRWLEEHSNRPKVLAVPFYKTELEGSALQAALEVGTPSRQDQLAVRRDNCGVPSRDVSMKKSEARHCCKSLEKKKQASVRYGYYDVGNGEMVQYEADGTPCVKVKSLKAYCERRICADGKIVETTQFRMKIPFKEAEGIKDLCGTTAGEFSEKVGSVSMDVKIGTCMPGEDMTMTVVAKDDCHPNAKIVSIVRATHDNYNLLYKGLDPKIPLRPKVPGVCEAIVPNAQSWNELYYNKTVPWPQVWRVPYDESASVSTAMGGVAARSIPVVEERRLIEQPARSHEGRTVVTGVRPPLLQEISITQVFDRKVLQCFECAWIKATPQCPEVKAVFSVTNKALEERWEAYKTSLSPHHQGVEKHFHGTTLACDILGTKGLCRNAQCGICRISDIGLDPKCIGTKIRDPRFGNGFYLAPHSSKCHKYTRGTNGYRAMLLCDVLPGRKYQTRTRESGPPTGYDSVEGMASGNTEPEIALYHPQAVMPRFVIVY